MSSPDGQEWSPLHGRMHSGVGRKPSGGAERRYHRQTCLQIAMRGTRLGCPGCALQRLGKGSDALSLELASAAGGNERKGLSSTIMERKARRLSEPLRLAESSAEVTPFWPGGDDVGFLAGMARSPTDRQPPIAEPREPRCRSRGPSDCHAGRIVRTSRSATCSQDITSLVASVFVTQSIDRFPARCHTLFARRFPTLLQTRFVTRFVLLLVLIMPFLRRYDVRLYTLVPGLFLTQSVAPFLARLITRNLFRNIA